MKTFTLATSLVLLAAGAADALTVRGSVAGGNLPPDLRVAGVVVTPFGQVVQEVWVVEGL